MDDGYVKGHRVFLIKRLCAGLSVHGIEFDIIFYLNVGKDGVLQTLVPFGIKAFQFDLHFKQVAVCLLYFLQNIGKLRLQLCFRRAKDMRRHDRSPCDFLNVKGLVGVVDVCMGADRKREDRFSVWKGKFL